jgi:hypothetical protein
MRRRFRLLGVLIVLVLAIPLQAGFPTIPPPMAQRVAGADLIVLGKVTAVDDAPVQAFPLSRVASTPKVDFRVATVRVEAVLLGPGKLDEVRVAYLTPPAPRRTPVSLRVGETGCFFLRKHPEEAFHIISTPYDFLDRSRKDFDRNIAVVRHAARLLAEPGPGLRSRDADERLLTAAVLIFRYRIPRDLYYGPPRTEPIDPEQSRQILKVLGDGELEPPELEEPFTRLSLFLSMNLTPKDGWTPPKVLGDVPGAVRKWLDENTGKYCIQRFLPAKP